MIGGGNPLQFFYLNKTASFSFRSLCVYMAAIPCFVIFFVREYEHQSYYVSFGKEEFNTFPLEC